MHVLIAIIISEVAGYHISICCTCEVFVKVEGPAFCFSLGVQAAGNISAISSHDRQGKLHWLSMFMIYNFGILENTVGTVSQIVKPIVKVEVARKMMLQFVGSIKPLVI